MGDQNIVKESRFSAESSVEKHSLGPPGDVKTIWVMAHRENDGLAARRTAARGDRAKSTWMVSTWYTLKPHSTQQEFLGKTPIERVVSCSGRLRFILVSEHIRVRKLNTLKLKRSYVSLCTQPKLFTVFTKIFDVEPLTIKWEEYRHIPHLIADSMVISCMYIYMLWYYVLWYDITICHQQLNGWLSIHSISRLSVCARSGLFRARQIDRRRRRDA